jgi:tetratricopeptide (TPR) repeat protein
MSGAPVTSSVEDGEHVERGELKVEPDTKNAHVWNELGNVYFNTGAFEEAVAAYSKAIELDDWFAWPYSNLALVHVQKEKYAEAILLYQRSIELFTSDKEKAITWNRLGNVYRRLNDYDNAIACYQRADELDPNNATRSLRSRYSLLGSMNLEQSPTLAV